MGELPEGWRIVALAEVADTSLGKMLDKARPKGDVRVPYLRNVNVQWGRIDTGDALTVELSEEECARFALESGDLLVCEGGEIGRCAIWTGGAGYMAYQKALHRVRSRGAIDLRWLRYLLEHYDNTGALAARATGSTILHLPQQQLRLLPIPLPPFGEQQRIVGLLEDHLSRLDAAEGGFARVSRSLAVLEASALRDCLEGPPVSLLELAHIQGGIQKQPKRAPAANAFPFLRVANVTKHGLDLDDAHQVELFDGELERLRLERGDLLVV